jgi:NAD(P)-dependent dehydrogenase (short-subunit alcohol dehydrogenase family)
MQQLAGKVALITGATSGIGEATAHLMASRGAKIIVGGLRQHEADKTAADIRAHGWEAIGVGGDVAEEAVIKSMVERGVDAFGPITVLHANAGLTTPDHTSRDGQIVDMEVDVWDRTMAVNLRGPMLCCKHVIPHMLAAGGGSIMMTSSGKGLQGDPDLPAYGTSKGALVTLGRYVAAQYGKQNIRCNILVLGLIQTPATTATFTPEIMHMVEEHHLTPYLGMPRDVAEVAAFLASDASRFITGHALVVDGGVTSHSPLYADTRRLGSGAHAMHPGTS